MSTWYRGESIRIKANGYDGIGVRFGKFAAEIRTETIRVVEDEVPDDPASRYGCIVANGCQCWGRATVADAYAMGAAWMGLNGWTEDYEEAKRAAIVSAERRHAAKRLQSTNYAHHYPDARMIVRAVNSHDALLAACRRAADALDRAAAQDQHMSTTSFDITPEQYHAGLTRLWDALGNPPMTEEDVFTRAAKSIRVCNDLLANLSGLLAWIDHAKLQPNERDHMPDDSYLQSARAAIARADIR